MAHNYFRKGAISENFSRQNEKILAPFFRIFGACSGRFLARKSDPTTSRLIKNCPGIAGSVPYLSG
ncbi:hypothetical protein [Porphyromonas loveana]